MIKYRIITMLSVLASTSAPALASDKLSMDELTKHLRESEQKIQAAVEASDFVTADSICVGELQLFAQNGAKRTEAYASLLQKHSEVLKKQLNYTAAQEEEAQALRIKSELRNTRPGPRTAPVPASAATVPASAATVPASAATVPASAATVPASAATVPVFGGRSLPVASAKSSVGATCAYGEARYTVSTAIGDMDCHLMSNGKGLVRVLNEKDASTQFVIQYPSLKCSVLVDERVNGGEIFRSNYCPCDAPPYMDEKGAEATKAKFLGKKVIDGHICSGWSSMFSYRGRHDFLCEMWFATDLHFPYQYSWSMKETPADKVTWKMAVFTRTPKAMVFDLSGYRDSGETRVVNPWLKWITR